jgi:hypothetical protein
VNRASNVTLGSGSPKRTRRRILGSKTHWLILRRIAGRADAIAENYAARCGC